jgi:hypothetical protein
MPLDASYFTVTERSRTTFSASQNGRNLTFGGVKVEADVTLRNQHIGGFTQGGELEGGLEVGFIQIVTNYKEVNVYSHSNGQTTEKTRYKPLKLPIKDTKTKIGTFYTPAQRMSSLRLTVRIAMNDMPTTIPATGHLTYGAITLDSSDHEQDFDLWIAAYHRKSDVYVAIKQYTWTIRATYRNGGFTRSASTTITEVQTPAGVPKGVLQKTKFANKDSVQEITWT